MFNISLKTAFLKAYYRMYLIKGMATKAERGITHHITTGLDRAQQHVVLRAPQVYAVHVGDYDPD